MLELRGIGMHYNISGREVTALSGVDMRLRQGSFTTVVGRSGCGKTTLLRILAGLVAPSTGEIRNEGGTALKTGVVFQEARLMPWLNITDNIAFGLQGRLDAAIIAARVSAILKITGLTAFRNALPSQLSGGMAQRVALARAVVTEPDLLLMDEPFAALDAFTRRGMQNELISLWQAQRPTIVFVTHDVEEAVLLGETVVELSEGRIVGQQPIPIAYPRDPTGAEEANCRRAILARLLAPAP